MKSLSAQEIYQILAIAEVSENRLILNEGNFFKVEQTSKDRLRIYDNLNSQVLDIHFLNSHSVRFKGRFFLPKYGMMQVSEESVIYGALNISGGCMISNIDDVSGFEID